jgi:hypothetical protein
MLLTKKLLSKMPEGNELVGKINAMNLDPSVFDKIVSKPGRDAIHILMDPNSLVPLRRFCAKVACINASNQQQKTDKWQTCVRLLEQLNNEGNRYYTGTIVSGVPHKVALTYLGRTQCLQHIPDTQIGDIPGSFNQTHALEILFRDQSAQALLTHFLAAVPDFAQMTGRAKMAKKIAQNEDNLQFNSAKSFMTRTGWSEDAAAASLRGSQKIINQKHFNESGTTMVLLANPDLGGVDDKDARDWVQKKTIPHFASPLYHIENQWLRARQLVAMDTQHVSGLRPNPTAAARTVPQLPPLTDLKFVEGQRTDGSKTGPPVLPRADVEAGVGAALGTALRGRGSEAS